MTRKDVKHVHLTVHPPNGTGEPGGTHRHSPGGGPRLRHLEAWLDSAAATPPARPSPRAEARLRRRARATTCGAGATCCKWSRPTAKPTVRAEPPKTHADRSGQAATKAKRAEVIHDWHKTLLHQAVPPLIRKWEPKLGVRVTRLLPTADEDQVGKLQPPRRARPAEHGAW